MPSWPWSKKKKSKGDDEGAFHAKSPTDRLADEGFKIVISSEVLEGRVGHQSETIEKGFKKPEGEFVDDIYRLYFASAAAWYRAMENDDAAERLDAFLERYNLERDLESVEALRVLREEGLFLINKSYVNIDVESRTPIIINKTQRYKRDSMTSDEDF